jgi:hypothetical protein
MSHAKIIDKKSSARNKTLSKSLYYHAMLHLTDYTNYFDKVDLPTSLST